MRCCYILQICFDFFFQFFLHTNKSFPCCYSNNQLSCVILFNNFKALQSAPHLKLRHQVSAGTLHLGNTVLASSK